MTLDMNLRKLVPLEVHGRLEIAKIERKNTFGCQNGG